MHIEHLTPSESRIVREVLRAAADGPLFPDWEFQALFGLERQDLHAIADAWPPSTADPRVMTAAVKKRSTTC
jgi:hypothetical protein